MKALVTGGAGFIGSNLVALLVSKGHTVTVFDSLVSGNKENLFGIPNLKIVVGDIRDTSILQYAARDVEVIWHMAASVGNMRSIQHPHLDSACNVIGTINVLEIAKAEHVRKVVFSSSAGVFGELKTLPIAEDHPVEPDSPYGASKLCAEKLCLAYAKLYPKFEAICLRYFNVFGQNQRYDAYGNVIPIFAHKLLNGEPITIFGDGEQTRDFIHVSDVAEANLLAGFNSGLSGVFNLGSGCSLSINSLVAQMFELTGRRTEVNYEQRRPGDVLHSAADIRAIKAALGFLPTANFKANLQKYLEWAWSQPGF